MTLPSSPFVFVFPALLLTLFLPHAYSQGLTFDECTSNANCISPRECVDIRRGTQCSTLSLSGSCRCFPDSPIQCLSDGACPTGEVCVASDDLTIKAFICISGALVNSNPSSWLRVTQPNPTRGALTGEPCTRNRGCLAPRICSLMEPGGFESCIGRSGCFCTPPVFTACERDTDCQEGERCGFSGFDICGARTVSTTNPKVFPNPNPAADPENVEDTLNNAGGSSICVAERHMNGVRGVFESGRHAKVLCDTQGSCATPGHLVVYRGKSMMMRRYCDVVGCVLQVMKVNSPRWERGLRLKSWSDGLEFTAFAARYETLAEEAFLTGLVRAGL